VCCCRSQSKDRIERKTDEHNDEMETIKSEKKVRKKMEERKPAASAANAGVSEDTGEKRRRSRRLSIKEELKDLYDDDVKFSAPVKDTAGVIVSDSEGVKKELPIKQESELDERKSIKDEVICVVILSTCIQFNACMKNSLTVCEYFFSE